MKNEHLQTDLKPRDEHDHSALTTVHHPEDQRTDLERWLRRTWENGPAFWGWVVGAIAVVALLVYVFRGSGQSRDGTAWSELVEAQSSSDYAEVAEKFPATKAESWALLRAADANFNDALERLPAQADSARPMLKDAQQKYQDVLEKAARDTPQARHASLGLARCLEVLNQPDAAIAQYKKVIDDYRDGVERQVAERAVTLLQAELKKPEAERFYTKLYAYKPPENPVPPALPGLGLGGDDSRLDGFLKPPIGGPDPLPLAPIDPKADAPATPKAEQPAAPEGEPKPPGA